MITAVIPARGGSKRLPGKNIADLAGRPLIAWSVLAAKASRHIDLCLVSTDDVAIADIAREYGAEIVMRPIQLAGDNSPTLDAIKHAVHTAAPTASTVVTLQPTNPLRPAELLDKAIETFQEQETDSLIGVTGHPLKTGKVRNGLFYPEYGFGQQSRLTEMTWWENGWVYITRRNILDNGSLCGDSIIPFDPGAPWRDLDIDDKADLDYGRVLTAAFADRIGY